MIPPPTGSVLPLADAAVAEPARARGAAGWWRDGSSLAPMLYGRDAERSRIGELLTGARQGHSGVLVLRGEAGVGKSALLEDARAQAAGMTVLGAAGVESEARAALRGPALGPAAVFEHARRPARPPGRGALTARSGRRRQGRGESVPRLGRALSLLAEAADHAPLLVSSTTPSGSTRVGRVARLRRPAAGRERIAVLFAARDGRPACRSRRPACPTCGSGGLAPEPAGDLLDRQAGVPLLCPGHPRAAHHRRRGGNPLALLALLHVAQRGAARRSRAAARTAPRRRAHRARFLGRSGGCRPETRLLLVVAAADDAGDAGHGHAGGRAHGRAGPRRSTPPRSRPGSSRVPGDRIEFRHPLVRSAVYHGARSRAGGPPTARWPTSSRRRATRTGGPGTWRRAA